MAGFIFIQFLILLSLVVAGSAFALVQFRKNQTLDDEIRRVNVSAIADFQELRRALDEFTERVDALEARLGSFQQNRTASVNYTQRSQALRLIRRGESVESITRTLGLPRGQVRLLMKLQDARQSEVPAPTKGAAQVAGTA